jgi:hypothetical protein
VGRCGRDPAELLDAIDDSALGASRQTGKRSRKEQSHAAAGVEQETGTPVRAHQGRASRDDRRRARCAAEAHLLVLHPPALDDYFRDLHEMWAGDEPPERADELALMRPHGVEQPDLEWRFVVVGFGFLGWWFGFDLGSGSVLG